MKEKTRKFIADQKKIHNGAKESVYLWCLHCERAYRRGECREVDGLQMCPYEGCNGDTVMDGWSWGSVREQHPDYPVIPAKGVLYPLYD